MPEDRVRQIEELVRRVELIPDADARQTALDLMGGVLDLHGTGLERMMEIVHDQGDSGKVTIRRLAADELVASLLVWCPTNSWTKQKSSIILGLWRRTAARLA
jgi:hypothetical protein